MKRKSSKQANDDSAIGDIEGGKFDSSVHTHNLSSGEFLPSVGLTSEECEYLLLAHGKNELPEKVVSSWYILMNLLLEPMPVMIWLAIVIEAVLYKWMDMTILLGIQLANASIAFYETTKAGNAVAALKASLRPEATVKRDGKWKHIDASLVVPGDLVLLATGSAVPADCRINEGCIQISMYLITTFRSIILRILVI